MKMKKILTLSISLFLVFSLISTFALTTGAHENEEWTYEEDREFEWVEDLEVDDSQPMIEITAVIENIGEDPEGLTLIVSGTEVESWEVEPGELLDIQETYEIEEKGEYVVGLYDQEVTIQMNSDVDIEEFLVNGQSRSVEVGMEDLIEIYISAVNHGNFYEEINIVIEDDTGTRLEEFEFPIWHDDSVEEQIPYYFEEPGEYMVYVEDTQREVIVHVYEEQPEEHELYIQYPIHGEVIEPGPGPFTFPEGEEVDLVVHPHERYRFDGWTGDIEEIEDPESTETYIVMEDNYEIIPEFSEIDGYELNIESPYGGEIIQPEETHMFFEEEQTIDLVAEPHENYEFNRWIGGLGAVEDPYSSQTQVTIEEDVHLFAEFVPVNPQLTVLTEGSGTVSLEGEEIDGFYQEFYEEGEEVTLSAEAYEGYDFYAWTGDVFEESDELEVTIEDNLVVRGLFIPEDIDVNDMAQQPEWEEGDSWAMGYEDDMEDLFTPIIEEMEKEIEDDEELEDITEIKDIDFDLDGDVGFYQIYEVIEANDDGYTVEVESGGGIEVEGSITVEAEMPEEGEYDPDVDPDDMPMEVRELVLTGGMHFTLDISGTVEYDENMAIEAMDLTIENEMSMDIEMEDVPFSEEFLETMWELENEEDPPEDQSLLIEYTDYEVSVSVDTMTTMNVEFDPALDFFNFPIFEGKEWLTPTTIDMSGSYSGEVDVTGVPDFIKEDFEEEFEVDFPIILEDELEELEAEIPFMMDGDIDVPQIPMPGVPLQCTGTEEISLRDGTVTDVHAIELGAAPGNTETDENEPHFKMLYSEDQGFLVEFDMYMGEELEEFGLADMSMVNMDPDQARDNMAEIRDEDPDDDDEVDEYELTVNIHGEGTVNVEDEDVEDGWSDYYEEGSTVTLEAESDDGWYFDGWTGTDTGEANRIDIEMDENKMITANFEQMGEDQVTLTINIEGDGATEPSGEEVYEIGDDATVTVDGEYEDNFIEWTGDVPDGEEEELEITIEMDENKEITAIFEDDDDDDEDDEIPGFSFILLLKAVTISLVVHKINTSRKEQ